MSSSTANSMNGHDALKARRNKWLKIYFMTEEGKARRERKNAKERERYASDPARRNRIKNRQRKNFTAKVSGRIRARLKIHRYIYLFCVDDRFYYTHDEGSHTFKRNGVSVTHTYTEFLKQFPGCFVGRYDLDSTYETIKKDINKFLARETKDCPKCRRVLDIHSFRMGDNHRRATDCKDCHENKRPPVEALPCMNRDVPCDGCEYEKPCRILELTCPRYRYWAGERGYKRVAVHLKDARIPDLHLDGSKPGPGVI